MWQSSAILNFDQNNVKFSHSESVVITLWSGTTAVFKPLLEAYSYILWSDDDLFPVSEIMSLLLTANDDDLFPVSENMSLLLLLMVFIPGLGSNLENLRIVDSLLKQYDRRATPTTNTGIPIKTAVQYYCISWVDKYSWKVSIPCSWNIPAPVPQHSYVSFNLDHRNLSICHFMCNL